MRRTSLLLLFIVVALLAIVSTVGTFLPHQMMMARMMGTGYGEGMGVCWPMVLTSSTIVIIISVVIYVIAFPSIRYSSTAEKSLESGIPTDLDPMDILMRVSKPDERAVLEVLRKSGGVCLQKDITYKTYNTWARATTWLRSSAKQRISTATARK